MAMHVLPWSEPSLTRAIDVLHQGGIVAHATETCYGFACDLGNPQAVEHLFTLKQRPAGQPVSALFSSLDQIRAFVHWTPEAEAQARDHLPGPLTLILHLRADAPRILHPRLTREQTADSRQQTVGVRLSSSPVAQKLVERFGSPLSTTSANLHGKPNPYSAQDIVAQFADQDAQPDLILDSGGLPNVPPSTVLDLTQKEPTVRRIGTLSAGYNRSTGQRNLIECVMKRWVSWAPTLNDPSQGKECP